MDTRLILGELLVHSGHDRGLPAGAVKEALEQSVALDPTNAEVLIHLVQVLFLTDDGKRMI